MIDFSSAAKRVKLVCLDMDGTLLGADREIPEPHKQIPAFLKKRGVRFTIVTGRPPYMCRKEVAEMGATEPMVCANGAMLCSPDGRLLAPGKFVSRAGAELFMGFLRRERIDHYVYTAERIYTCPDEFPHASRWRARLATMDPAHRWEVLTLDRFDPARERVLKFLVCTDRHETVAGFLDAHPEIGLNHARTTPESIDVCAAEADKGRGLTALCGLLGVPLAETMVFGDGGNDLPMFAAAGYGIAMANAADFVKARASATTEFTSDEGGAYRFLQRVFA